MRTLRILGIRGIPAGHGGFETFAERLALYLVSRGWRVIVYCQAERGGARWSDVWQGVDRVHIPVAQSGPLGTMVFDLRAILHAVRSKDDCLTLGYNTAIFFILLKLFRIKNVVNMDGIEWKRAKWSLVARAWFWINEKIGCWLGDRLIADHPAIRDHLLRVVRDKTILVIPYGADVVSSAFEEELKFLGLSPGSFATLIARPEPENSVLEIVSAFSRRPRGIKLVVLGAFDATNEYHQRVRAAAGNEIIFAGAIYDKAVVGALRKFSIFYAHGHQVGGTNPSLVEALAAGNPVIAHDNVFNRWVAGDGAVYFADEDAFSVQLERLLSSPQSLVDMGQRAFSRYEAHFTWERVLLSYEAALS